MDPAGAARCPLRPGWWTLLLRSIWAVNAELLVKALFQSSIKFVTMMEPGPVA